MERTGGMKSWSMHNLPVELWIEILSRLPVKSLLRFRCVSRSWLLLIDEPGFCRLHLTRFKNNCNETHLLFAQGEETDQGCAVVRRSKTLRTTQRLGSPTLGHGKKWAVLCAVDGLVMLRTGLGTPRPELMLWNPSIRKSRSVPLSPEHSVERVCIDVGLGFDPLTRDYKHIRFVKCGLNDLDSVDVYTVGTDLWRTIQVNGNGCSSWQWCFLFRCFRRPVCFRGALYFIDMNRNTPAWELASFDLSNEVFALTCCISDDRDFSSDGSCLTLVDGGDSLALCRIRDNLASVWVLEKSGNDDDSARLTIRFTFSASPVDSFLYTRMNGHIFLGWKEIKSYNPKTRRTKLLLRDCPALTSFRVSRYVESLILLK